MLLQIQADEASKAKSRFLATVSHELRTPLHGLLGFADLLRETSPMSSEQVRGFGPHNFNSIRSRTHRRNMLVTCPHGLWQLAYVEMLRSTGRALMSIVNDILELSRIEAGTVVFAPVPFYIGDCVREVLDVVYGQAWYVISDAKHRLRHGSTLTDTHTLCFCYSSPSASAA